MGTKSSFSNLYYVPTVICFSFSFVIPPGFYTYCVLILHISQHFINQNPCPNACV